MKSKFPIQRGPNRTGKPPKLRFQPGQYLKDPKDGTLYRIKGAFLLKEDPHKWIFRLEDQTPLTKQTAGMFLLDVVANLTATPVPAVVSVPFRSAWDAGNYFASNFPVSPGVRGDTVSVKNQDLLKWHVISPKE